MRTLKFILLFLIFQLSKMPHATAQGKKVLLGNTTLSAFKAPNVSIYASSREGDRLTGKATIKFATNQDSVGLSVILVNDTSLFQRIEGFGATFNEAGMIAIRSLSASAQKKVFKSLFDTVSGAGYTLMKSPIAACDFASAGNWYNYDPIKNDTLMDHFSIERDLGPNGLVTFIKTAKNYGKFEIESPMDFAPDWMYKSLKKGEKHIKPEYYKALARYYSKYLDLYAKNGVTINFLDLFNEANNSWYSNETYKEIGQLIKNYVAPELRANGLNTRIQFGETPSRPEGIQKFPPGLDDPQVRNKVNSLTVHGYDWDKFSSLTDLHNKYPELPIWMTEVCYAYSTPTVKNIPPGGPTKMPVYGFDDGEFWGNMIVNDLKNWVSGWIYWNMVLDQTGGPWLTSVEHGDPAINAQHPVVIINRKTQKVTYTGLYYYLAHFSKFVRPGAYRINCTGSSANLNYVGFKNPDGSIVVNVINNGLESNCKIVWNNEAVVEKLPSHSITTFIWKG